MMANLKLIVALLLAASCLASAAEYCVDPKGDDANAGTESQPWKTLQKAADTLVAGDTVRIKAGTYHERVIPKNSGSPGKPITYAAFPGMKSPWTARASRSDGDRVCSTSRTRAASRSRGFAS